ncbi:sugar phosphate isomerase/epimerase [Sinomonas sp. JGH33]|uniref:Sugar phosphate isomerase/epimerase n=1 Tax=Sinomonas terricola TaxID=3110330 RepID=A0ABU5T2A2_9MICC|nr:sugar phosphate isomerase/epimerase [Sinomonas sp. JGH33]MEA5453784.1 sugar phosphate isomerase/epimerase [Sinomonas sp. JGH33]
MIDGVVPEWRKSDSVPDVPIGLSSASVYPLSVHDAFACAADLGYDGVEVMVTNNSASQDPHALIQLSERYDQPIVSIHAPTLLLTQQVWGGAWSKVRRSCEMARAVGSDTVVVHPPFRWQSGYAEGFPIGIRDLADEYEVHIAVENMYPWRVRGRETRAYLPHWDPVGQDYRDVTWDFSHAATAREDSLESLKALGDSLRHIHLTDGSGGSFRDEHLLPGQGTQRVAECLQFLADSAFDGVVVAEVSTRKAKAAGEREQMLAEVLDFAREHLGHFARPGHTSATEQRTS